MDSIEFITNENVEMLWEIIKENNIQQINSQSLRERFIQEIKAIYDKEKNKKIDLMKLNKEFITVFSQNIKNKTVIPQKNNLVTFEEIHEDRISQFEKDLQLKKNDFEDSIKLKIPESPNFNDDSKDKPIKEMEQLIAKTLSQRNFEIEQINQNIDKKEVEKWLKGEETSIKKEKEPIRGEIKYIKIGDPINDKNEAIDISLHQKKSISWDPTLDNDDSIFSKLKKKPSEIDEIKEQINKINEKLDFIMEKLNK
jgi:hypothetical protein